jgi:hypothetical protein
LDLRRRRSESKSSLRRSERRWEDNIRMDRRKIGWEGVDWIYMAEDRDQWRTVVNMVIKLRVL